MFGISKNEQNQRKNRNAAIRTFDNIFKSVRFVERFFERFPKSKLSPRKVYGNNLGWFVRGFNFGYNEARKKLMSSFEQYLGNKDLETHLRIVLGIETIKESLHLLNDWSETTYHSTLNPDTYSYSPDFLGQVLGLLFACMQEGLILEAFTFSRESSQEIYLIYESMAEKLREQFPDANLTPIQARIFKIAEEVGRKDSIRKQFLIEIANLFS